MSNFLFLVHRMSMGYGVSVVVDALSRNLVSLGHSVTIGTLDYDYEIPNVAMVKTGANAEFISYIAENKKIDIIIAHTSPFFEILPSLSGEFACWAYEHGDPSPDFFVSDRQDRRNIIENKRINVYPNIQGVIAISDFIKNDIRWKSSVVIYNGADHLPDIGEKSYSDFLQFNSRPLRIGTLMRLGIGESSYKGNGQFLTLCKKIQEAKIPAELCVMGRGTESDAEIFRQNGINVFLNASDEERSKYLRNLDIFISPSLWEGFNLPLVEAMKSGTLAIAFDTGAHPEVTPFVFSSVDEMFISIVFYAKNYAKIYKDSKRCHDYVNAKFTWSKTTFSLLDTLFFNNNLKKNEKKKSKNRKFSIKAKFFLKNNAPFLYESLRSIWHVFKNKK